MNHQIIYNLQYFLTYFKESKQDNSEFQNNLNIFINIWKNSLGKYFLADPKLYFSIYKCIIKYSWSLSTQLNLQNLHQIFFKYFFTYVDTSHDYVKIFDIFFSEPENFIFVLKVISDNIQASKSFIIIFKQMIQSESLKSSLIQYLTLMYNSINSEINAEIKLWSKFFQNIQKLNMEDDICIVDAYLHNFVDILFAIIDTNEKSFIALIYIHLKIQNKTILADVHKLYNNLHFANTFLKILVSYSPETYLFELPSNIKYKKQKMQHIEETYLDTFHKIITGYLSQTLDVIFTINESSLDWQNYTTYEKLLIALFNNVISLLNVATTLYKLEFSNILNMLLKSSVFLNEKLSMKNMNNKWYYHYLNQTDITIATLCNHFAQTQDFNYFLFNYLHTFAQTDLQQNTLIKNATSEKISAIFNNAPIQNLFSYWDTILDNFDNKSSLNSSVFLSLLLSNFPIHKLASTNTKSKCLEYVEKSRNLALKLVSKPFYQLKLLYDLVEMRFKFLYYIDRSNHGNYKDLMQTDLKTMLNIIIKDNAQSKEMKPNYNMLQHVDIFLPMLKLQILVQIKLQYSVLSSIHDQTDAIHHDTNDNANEILDSSNFIIQLNQIFTDVVSEDMCLYAFTKEFYQNELPQFLMFTILPLIQHLTATTSSNLETKTSKLHISFFKNLAKFLTNLAKQFGNLDFENNTTQGLTFCDTFNEFVRACPTSFLGLLVEQMILGLRYEDNLPNFKTVGANLKSLVNCINLNVDLQTNWNSTIIHFVNLYNMPEITTDQFKELFNIHKAFLHILYLSTYNSLTPKKELATHIKSLDALTKRLFDSNLFALFDVKVIQNFLKIFQKITTSHKEIKESSMVNLTNFFHNYNRNIEQKSNSNMPATINEEFTIFLQSYAELLAMEIFQPAFFECNFESVLIPFAKTLLKNVTYMNDDTKTLMYRMACLFALKSKCGGKNFNNNTLRNVNYRLHILKIGQILLHSESKNSFQVKAIPTIMIDSVKQLEKYLSSKHAEIDKILAQLRVSLLANLAWYENKSLQVSFSYEHACDLGWKSFFPFSEFIEIYVHLSSREMEILFDQLLERAFNYFAALERPQSAPVILDYDKKYQKVIHKIPDENCKKWRIYFNMMYWTFNSFLPEADLQDTLKIPSRFLNSCKAWMQQSITIPVMYQDYFHIMITIFKSVLLLFKYCQCDLNYINTFLRLLWNSFKDQCKHIRLEPSQTSNVLYKSDITEFIMLYIDTLNVMVNRHAEAYLSITTYKNLDDMGSYNTISFLQLTLTINECIKLMIGVDITTHTLGDKVEHNIPKLAVTNVKAYLKWSKLINSICNRFKDLCLGGGRKLRVLKNSKLYVNSTNLNTMQHRSMSYNRMKNTIWAVWCIQLCTSCAPLEVIRDSLVDAKELNASGDNDNDYSRSKTGDNSNDISLCLTVVRNTLMEIFNFIGKSSLLYVNSRLLAQPTGPTNLSHQKYDSSEDYNNNATRTIHAFYSRLHEDFVKYHRYDGKN